MADSETVTPSLLARVHANFAERARMQARLAGGAIEEWDDAVLVMVGAFLPPANAAIVVRPPRDPDALLARARAFFGRHGVSWALRTTPEAATVIGPAALAAGLTPAEPMPGMLLMPIAGEPPSVPGLTIQVVADAATLSVYNETASGGPGMPRDVYDGLYPPSVLAEPDITFYLGLHDGVPVATAGRISSHRIAQVFGVGTSPAYRRRGIGEAMTWRATLDGREEGCIAAFLLATPMGFPLYARMGYRHVIDYQTWVSEAEAEEH